MFPALIACEWLHVGAALLVFGAGAVGRMLHAERYGWNGCLDRTLLRAMRAAALLALLSAGAWLLLEAASMSGVWGDAIRPSVIRAVLTDTEFGHLWMARLALAALVCLVALGRKPSVALGVAAAALLGSLALTGHAVMHTGWLGLGQRLNEAAHLLAAGFWLGGLLPLGLLLSESPELWHAVRALRRFSDVGVATVLLLLGSGVVNAWILLGHPSALLHGAYGRTLLVKLVLVAALVAIALGNRVLVLPALAAAGDAALGRMERNVKLEIMLGAMVVLAAVVLANLAPPGM